MNSIAFISQGIAYYHHRVAHVCVCVSACNLIFCFSFEMHCTLDDLNWLRTMSVRGKEYNNKKKCIIKKRNILTESKRFK